MFILVKIGMIILYIVVILLCRRKIRKITKKSMYSYQMVSILGLMIFLIVLVLYDTYKVIEILSVSSEFFVFPYSSYAFFSDLTTMFTDFTMVLFPLAILFAIFLAISNVILLVVEGKSLTNILGIVLGLSLIVGTLLVKDVYGILDNIFDVHSYVGYCISLAIENVISITLTYIECMMMATIYVAFKCARHKVKTPKDYVIVLGCRVLDDGRPGGMLRKRVEAALDYVKTQPESRPAMVFSGGQGSDEPISEAKSMENYAVSKKYNGKMILEDKSKTTRQNFIFSKEKIGTGENVAFSTTDFHVFRSGVIATKNGFRRIEGISARSPWYYYNNALIREFAANLSSEKAMHIFNLLVLNAMSVLLILVCYFFDLI